MTDGYLSISNLVKTYPGTTTPAVDNVNLSLARGQMLALLGPSGCGKTTTLRMIAGLIEPTSGAICVNGEDITRFPVHKRGLGMVFQSYALFPHLSVAENVAFGLEMRGVGRDETRMRVRAALDMVQLGAMSERRITQLSGGQQQRIALARALVVKPSVLLLDEPLSNLDAKLRDAMRNEIRDIQQKYGITAVFVTHDQDEALSMADSIAVMSKGKVEQIGTPEDIYLRPATRFAAEFVGRANFFEGNVRSSANGNIFDVAGVAELAANAKMKPGATTLMVRPHRIAISMDGGLRDKECVLRGTVEQRSYTGELIHYGVRVGEQLINAEVLSGSSHEPALGASVCVGWSLSDAVALGDHAA